MALGPPESDEGRAHGGGDGWLRRLQDRRRGEAPDAVAVMDPFHVVRLAGDALDDCRRRVQQHIHGHRGRKGDPLYGARRTCTPGCASSPERQGRDWTRCSPTNGMARSRPRGSSISGS